MLLFETNTIKKPEQHSDKTTGLMILNWVPAEARELSLLQNCAAWLWDPRSLLFNEHQELFLWNGA